jgi:hypothetical protein
MYACGEIRLRHRGSHPFYRARGLLASSFFVEADRKTEKRKTPRWLSWRLRSGVGPIFDRAAAEAVGEAAVQEIAFAGL